MGEAIAEWHDFFVAVVGAAAALAGLVAVAISINLHRILEYANLPGRAAEALAQPVCAMLVGGFSLMPLRSAPVLGMAIAASGLLLCIISAMSQIRAFKLMSGQPVKWWRDRMLMSLVSGPPVVIGGALIALGMPNGMYWAGVGVLLSLAMAVANTWVLLVEILR